MARLVVIIGFLVAFSAGLVVGLQARLAPAAVAASATTRPRGPGGWLTSELGLSSEQQSELDRIWSETARRGRSELDDRRRASRKERDEAISGLIRAEDRGRYEETLKAYTDKQAALDKEMKSNFQAAVERTKQILTPAQRGKYEEILRKREAEALNREHNRRPEDRATSRPAQEK